MNRLDNFTALEMHAWYKNQYKKLSTKHIKLCIDFILENKDLSVSEFEAKVNRMFIDCDFSKNKKSEQNRLRICQELISVSNSI